MVACLSSGGVWAQQWPQWRGPDCDGVVEIHAPANRPAELTTKRKVEVGEGYASPLRADGRLFQFARQGDDEVALSLDPASGRVLWPRAIRRPMSR